MSDARCGDPPALVTDCESDRPRVCNQHDRDATIPRGRETVNESGAQIDCGFNAHPVSRVRSTASS